MNDAPQEGAGGPRRAEILSRVARISEGYRGSHPQSEAGHYHPAGHVCLVCGHTWDAVIKGAGRPKRCPACDSSLWDVGDALKHTCVRCSHTWSSRLESPAVCPRCRSGLWRTAEKKHTCAVCGHVWEGRAGKDMPARCPRCDSRRWGKELHRHICVACSHEWMGRSEVPLVCPKCLSKSWNKDVRIFSCGECGHVWRAGPEERRLTLCPECFSSASTEMADRSCPGCGYDGLVSVKDDACPSCGAVLPVLRQAGRASACRECQDGLRTEAYHLAFKVLCSDSTDRKKVKDLVQMGLHPSDADVMIRYSRGEDVTDIARGTGLSIDRIIKTIRPLAHSGHDGRL
ncbi:MAG: hypothetical protein FWH47_01895 [Methanomassiliicoccaceae archaeon]|nr:hypothetical protein [Methanomassiliicoccaceae archaeon]